MAQKKYTTRTAITAVFSPLLTSFGIEVCGNVPAGQTYAAGGGLYSPDYTLTPLVLEPRLSIDDPDGVLPSGYAEIANPRWTVLIDGTATVISATDPDYELALSTVKDTAGNVTAHAGQLVIKRNIPAGGSAAFTFEGDYADTRTGEMLHFADTVKVACDTIDIMPTLTFDLPEVYTFNPLRETASTVTVTARLRKGVTDVPADQRLFVWEVLRPDGTWSAHGEYGENGWYDLDCQVSSDGTAITIDPILAPARLTLRCRAQYDPEGMPATKPLSAMSPSAQFDFVRDFGRLDVAAHGSLACTPGQQAMHYVARMYDTTGEIPDPEKWFAFTWDYGAGLVSGKVVHTRQATGRELDLPVAGLAGQYGTNIDLTAEELPEYAVLTLADGTPLTTNGTDLLVCRAK